MLRRIMARVFLVLFLAVFSSLHANCWAAPTVTAVDPPDGGRASVSTSVSATFGGAMSPATITSGSFTLSRFAGFKAVAAGVGHTVALKNDGTVVAWGDNSYGQSSIPADLSGVTAIAAGAYHTVALRKDGTVVAWGWHSYGQCTIPEGLAGVTAIAAGYYHTVALKYDGTVVAWGVNSYGQCTIPAGLSGVAAIAAGASHTVALQSDGTVVAWGRNENGQCTIPGGLSGVSAIAAGWFHTVALKSDGTVVAWGRNYEGQCTVPEGLSGVTAIAAGKDYTVALKADGTAVAWKFNDVPADLSGVMAIAAGEDHSVALKNDGTVAAWGSNDMGQTDLPVGISGAMDIAAGNNHIVALKNDGTVIAWGGNCANGHSTTVPAGLSGVTAVAAGEGHYEGFSLALKDDGTVVAWGDYYWGQLNIPAGLSEVVAIAAGDGHAVALKSNGTVVAWGGWTAGQTAVPAGLSGVTAIAAGDSHTVALKNDGTVVAWGSNWRNQSIVPANLNGVKGIAAGDYHTLALKNDGTVVAWGDNSYGQCAVPAGLSGVTAIAAGEKHAVALKNDGTVVAWGQASVPVGLHGVTKIAAGDFSTLAIKEDGTVVVWGNVVAFSPLDPYESIVEGTVAYEEGTRTAIFSPTAPLEAGVTYLATVNTGVRGATGIPLAAAVRWSFTAVALEPKMTVSPLSHDFGDVHVGNTSAPQTFTITNTGTADLMIDAVDLFGGDASMFDVTPGGPNPCQSLVPTVPPDSDCTIVAAFSPSSAGSKSTTLSISGNDPDTATAVIPLTGNGVARGVPDLVVSSLSAPTKAGAAASVTLTDTTKNQGTGTAVASTTRFYWSTNRIWSADDILLGSRSIPMLAAGAVSTGNTTITVPENAIPGIFYIIAKADADNANTEIREINNTRAKPIRIGPDLYVCGLTAPASAMRGSKVSITDTTGNRGGGAAEPSMTNLYLSRDTLLGAEDVLLGGRAVGSLGAGARSAGKTTVTIPVGTTPGAYFIIAMADDGNRVIEINEANNKRYRPITVIKDFTGIEPIHDNLRFAPDCSNMHCHGPEVTFDKIYGIHGNECAKCHDSRRPDVVAAIARGEAGTPVDCLQCHTYDTNLHHQAEDWQKYPASCLGCHQP